MTVCAPALVRKKQDPQRFLAALRRRVWDKPPGSLVKLLDYRLRITDGPNAYMQCKDVFVRGIYRFQCDCPDPLIIDGGSNMGLSILGFKRDHPRCRIIGFEPDPAILAMLRENLQRNRASEGVTLIEAGFAAQDGVLGFAVDGSAGGKLADSPGDAFVRVVRLSAYLTEPIDFLKLNIEGQELPVLQECAAAGALKNVREMVVEYHGWPNAPQRLADLLRLLDCEGFRYLLHDFDDETCTASKPPFRHRPNAPWFCLVHARRP